MCMNSRFGICAFYTFRAQDAGGETVPLYRLLSVCATNRSPEIHMFVRDVHSVPSGRFAASAADAVREPADGRCHLEHALAVSV